jgi:GNAT superfamily N-acetyltransferase
MTLRYRIRPLTTEDAAATVALLHAAFAAQSAATDPPSSALRETAATVAAKLGGDGGGAAAETAGTLIGAILWNERETGLYLSRLAVAPAWRQRGIARHLIAAAEAEARRRGAARLELSVRLVLADNRSLFASCGFRELRLTCHPGYSEPTSVEMAKRLAAAPEYAGR